MGLRPFAIHNKRIFLMTKKLFMTLFIGLCMMCFINCSQAAELTTHEVKSKIVRHAQSIGVDPAVALSIAKLESNYNPQLKSRDGAVGLYQLMPDTAKRLGVNPWLVNENIKGGLMYYQMLYKKFGSLDLALAAYNAGPGNVSKYNGIPPFRQTHLFIKKIKDECNSIKADPEYNKMLQSS